MVFRRFTAALCCVSENMRSTATEWSRRSSTSCVRSRRKQASDVTFRRPCSSTRLDISWVKCIAISASGQHCERNVFAHVSCVNPLNNIWKEKVLCCSPTLCIGCFRVRISVGKCSFVAIAVRKWRKNVQPLWALAAKSSLLHQSSSSVCVCVCAKIQLCFG